ncbi:hypothetical protein [Limoniibacter endophyticus]|nr:hypothetical protein [Limoniibacter endophyticus]
MIFVKGILAAGITAAAIGGSAHAADYDRPIFYPETNGGLSGMTGNVEGALAKSENDLLDSRNWSIRGSVNARVSGGLNIQGDLGYGKHDFDFIGDGSSYYGTLHGYYRPEEVFAVGAFIHGAKTDLDALGSADLLETRMAGLEVAWFSDAATFYAQGGYGKTDLLGLDADHLMGRLGIRYFLADNIRIDAEGTVNRLSTDIGDIDHASAKALLNYRPDGLPVSVYGGYRKDWLEPKSGGASPGSTDSQSILAGLRFHFGSDSLKEEERNGPIWSSAPILQP